MGFWDHPTHVQHLTGALGGWERAPSPWGLGEHRRGSSGSCGVAPLDTRSLSIPDPQRVQPRSSRCPHYRVGVQGVGAHATCARGCAAAEVMGRCFKTSPLRMFWGCWRLSRVPAPTRCHFSPLLKHPSPGLHGAFSPIPKAPVLSPFSSLQDGAQALSTVQDEPQLSCGAVVVPSTLPLPGSCSPQTRQRGSAPGSAPPGGGLCPPEPVYL